MHHVAIMKKSWGLIPKILNGEKTVESRWFKNKHTPWNKVKIGDTLWFKNTGEPVTASAKVPRILQFENINETLRQDILKKYGQSDLGLSNRISEEVMDYFRNKNYCILIFFDSVQKAEPFNIDKTGFGAMSAWICTEDICKIRKK